MAQTLVGVFDNRNDAQQVAQELIGLGIEQTRIRISDQEASGSTSSGGSHGGGFWESVKDAFGMGDDDDDRYGLREASRRGGTIVTVTTDEAYADRVTDVMRRHNVVNLDERARQWGSEGWAGHQRYQASEDFAPNTATAGTSTAGMNMANTGMADATTASADMAATARPQRDMNTAAAASTTRQGEEAIPVIEEELHVGKRQVSRGGVRVVSHVTERPVEEQVGLREEHVHVERRPVDRPLTGADVNDAFRERTIEATETAEEAVVAKEARVVEEVVVNKDVAERTETVRDTVRRTDVDVERTDAGDTRFRPAYEFADELSADTRYHGRSFDDVEPELRSSFEQRNPSSRWDDVRDAVRSRFGRSRSNT